MVNPTRSHRHAPPQSRRRAVRTAVITTALFVATVPASAQLKSWNAAGGMWNNAGNWTPIGMPQPADQVFIGNLAAAQNAFMTLNVNATIASLSISDGMVLETTGGQIVVNGATTISGVNSDGQFSWPSRLRVANGPAAFDAVLSSATVSNGGRIQLDGGALAVNGVLTVNESAAVSGVGTITLTSNAPVAMVVDGSIQAGIPGLTINQNGTGRIDLDGNVGGAGVLTVATAMIDGTDFAKLTINGTGLADPMDDNVALGRGNRLSMNLDEGWTLGPGATMSIFSGNNANPPTRVTGGLLRLDGHMLLQGANSLLHVEAPLQLRPSASAQLAPLSQWHVKTNATIEGGNYDIGAGAVLRFDGPTTVKGGHFSTPNTTFDGVVLLNGATTYDGTVTFEGSARQNGNATVQGPTVINAGRFDLDGVAESTEWTINNGLVVNALSLDQVNSVFNGTMNIVNTTLGKLTVNLDSPFHHWTLGAPPAKLNLGGVGALMTTRIDGSPMAVFGVVEVTNAVRIASMVRLEPTALIAFTTPTSRLRFGDRSHVSAGTGFFGEGRIENQSGALMTLAPGASIFPTDLQIGGTLRISPYFGSAPGIAMVDRAIFEPTSTWQIEIGGAEPGVQHDQLQLFGSASTLAGELEVDLFDLGDGVFEPEVGEMFVVLQAPPTTLSGEFVDGPITTVPGKSFVWSVGYQSGEVADIVTLTVADIIPCPADLNGDGLVDGADLGILLSAWGACDECLADLNGDGVVDGADLGILLTFWGACPLP